jgi:hypothetical protein
VQQPGMTGQVKEDIISRFFELGIRVEKGRLSIFPGWIDLSEFRHLNVNGVVPQLSFTYCTVPFIYLSDGREGIEVVYQDGNLEQESGYSLSLLQSQAIFRRDNMLKKVVVHL